MKDVKVSEKVHARLARYGRKDQTFSDVITELLSETRILPSFKEKMQDAIEKSEKSKREGFTVLAHEAFGILETASKQLIAEIEQR